MINTIKMESTRVAFGKELFKLVQEGYDIVTISADTHKSMQCGHLFSEYPKRCIEVGIAEQNMMMVAAGLASCGKIAFVTSYSVFTSMRALEQFRTFIAYPRLNVKVIAGLGGFTAGIEGVTHIALEDLGIIRCIPEVVLINPADAISTRKAVKEAVNYKGPVYIRIGRDPSPVIFNENYQFILGKANLLINEGNDVAILATGIMLFYAKMAVEKLKKEGVGAKLLEVHTLKPIDEKSIIEIANTTKAIVTVEEHNIIGGLGSAVAEVLVREYPIPMEQVAVPDRFTESGAPDELRNYYGLSIDEIVHKAKKVISRKKKSIE